MRALRAQLERGMAVLAAGSFISAAALLPPAPAPVRPGGVCLYGTQSVPKFDERLGRGAWTGSRDRGMAMFEDLGVELARQGLIWDVDEPGPGASNAADFDDAVRRLTQARIPIEFMATDTPLWAALAYSKNPDPASYRHAVPIGLYEPVFIPAGQSRPGWLEATGSTGKRAAGGRNASEKVDPRNYFAAFLAKYVQRYRGKVAYYQIWNEPDYPRGDLTAAPGDPNRYFQGSVADYARMLHVGAEVVRRYDPHAQLVTGGIGSGRYLDALLDRGAGRDFDVLDFHAYGGPGSDRALERFLAVAQRMRQALDAHGLVGTPLACSETGYPGSDPQGQHDYAIKVLAMSAALGLRYVCWYATTNPSWENMGLVDWDTMTHQTAAYGAFKEAVRWLQGARYVGRMALGPAAIGLVFQRPRGRFAIAWAPYRNAPLRVRVPGLGTVALTESPIRIPLGKQSPPGVEVRRRG